MKYKRKIQKDVFKTSLFIFLISLISLFLYGIFNKKLSIPSLSKTLPDVLTVEKQINEFPKANIYEITCGDLGFSGGVDAQGYYKTGGNYVIYSSPQRQFGKKLEISLTADETSKMDSALLLVIPQHPPQYNPDISICWTPGTKILFFKDTKNQGEFFVLKLSKDYSFEQKILGKISNQKLTEVKALALTKDNHLYLEISGKDNKSYQQNKSVAKISLGAQTFEIVGLGFPQSAGKLSQGNPVDPQIYSAKTFRRGASGSIDGSYFKFIRSNPDEELLSGVCVPYAYNQNSKTYESLDQTHPRYGGYSQGSLDSNTSLEITNILTNANFPINASIFFCKIDQNNKILNVLPVEGESSRNVFVALLDNSFSSLGSVSLMIPQYGSISSFDPEAFTKEQIFYLKLSGELNGGDVNLFKIDFNNSLYQTLYQGK